MLSPLYMAEISPPEVRGSLMALEQFSIVLGAVLGFWTGFFTRDGECEFELPGLLNAQRVELSAGSFVLADTSCDSDSTSCLACVRIPLSASVSAFVGSAWETYRGITFSWEIEASET